MNEWKPCSHPRTEVRQKPTVTGLVIFRVQCLTCGNGLGPQIRRAEAPKSAPPWDDDLREKYWRADLARREAASRKQREQEHTAWKVEHDAYLRTPQWHSLRERCRARAGGLCEGCRLQPGTQAHHISYAHWRNELLWELQWVCDACHRRAHEVRRAD